MKHKPEDKRVAPFTEEELNMLLLGLAHIPIGNVSLSTAEQANKALETVRALAQKVSAMKVDKRDNLRDTDKEGEGQ